MKEIIVLLGGILALLPTASFAQTAPIIKASVGINGNGSIANISCGAVAVNPQKGLTVQLQTREAYSTQPMRKNEPFFPNADRPDNVTFAVTFLQIGQRNSSIEFSQALAGNNDVCWQAAATILRRQQTVLRIQQEAKR